MLLRNFARLSFAIFVVVNLFAFSHANAANRPNILWLTSEDNGPEIGCYGDDYATTPSIDKLSEKSLRYQMCWSNAPVCAPARTTIISGMYATSLGGHHMRSGVVLPKAMKLYPKVLRKAGYYCTNNSKTDYNFAGGEGLAGWNDNGRKASWKNRPDDSTPFFAVFNYTISHESKIRNKPHTLVHDPAKAKLPVYHPDTPEVRRDWAQYYDRLTEMDAMVGNELEALEKAGLADSTIIFYYGDHGSGMPRSKRWPFNSGLQVPLLVHVPEAFKDLAPKDYLPGGVTDRLVSFVDLGPTAISLAGEKPPSNMQGVPFMGKHEGEAKEYLFGYRGRMDERIDRVRSCTDGRYVYMRHFYPDRPYLKHVSYMFETPTTQIWKQLFDEGKLNAAQAKFWQEKPVEELFDLQTDPDEVNNLSTDPNHSAKLNELRAATRKWMLDTRDLGLMPEAMVSDRCGERPPRSVAMMESFEIAELVDAAWAATDAWEACDQNAISDMKKLLQSEKSSLRYWGCRGLSLGLQSHGSVMENAATTLAIKMLTESLQDESASVQIAACDGLLEAIELSDDIDQTAIADQLMDLANVENHGHFAAVAALNVIDAQRELMGDQLDENLKKLPVKLAKPPVRIGKYVGRLLDFISE